MEELRVSIRMKEEENFLKKRSMLVESFQQKGYKANQKLTKDMPFIQKIKDEPDHMLWQILINSYYIDVDQLITYEELQQKELYDEITILTFIDQCMEALKRFHLEIYDHTHTIKLCDTSSSQFIEAQKILSQDRVKISVYPNEMNVAYFKDKAYFTEIFTKYKIKYKLEYQEADKEPQLLSVFGHNEEKKCAIPISHKTEQVVFIIQGKPIDPLNDERGVFTQLSRVELPFIEVLTSIAPRSLAIDEIIKCFLLLSYNDDSRQQLFDQSTQFEVQFELSLNKEERQEIILTVLKYYDELRNAMKEQIKNKMKQVVEVLLPFEENAKYVEGQGLVQDKQRSACESCQIQ